MTSPFYYPEDYGAVGDGVTDDSAALQQAILSCPPWNKVFYSRAYATSKTLTCTSGAGFDSSSAATLVGIDGCASAFSFTGNGSFRGTLPKLSGFTGMAILHTLGICTVDCLGIENCGGALQLSGGAINNNFAFQFISGCGIVLKVTNPGAGVVQGNQIKVNFANGCLVGLSYDGTPNCDSNTLEFGSWDSVNLAGAVIFQNTGPVPLSNWRLRVTDWIGGLISAPAAGAGLIAKGAMQFCDFICGNFVTGPENWDAFAITTGGGNTFRGSTATGFDHTFFANWRVQTNDRANCGAAEYMNTRLFKGQCAPMPAGTLFETYVYTPFYDGNSFGYRVAPVVNPGFELVSIKDNSGVVKGEVIVTWRAVNAISVHAPASYDEFDFQFTSGLP